MELTQNVQSQQATNQSMSTRNPQADTAVNRFQASTGVAEALKNVPASTRLQVVGPPPSANYIAQTPSSSTSFLSPGLLLTLSMIGFVIATATFWYLRRSEKPVLPEPAIEEAPEPEQEQVILPPADPAPKEALKPKKSKSPKKKKKTKKTKK